MLKRKLQEDIHRAIVAYKGLGVVASFFSFWQGRATFFGILFAGVGVAFAVVGVWGFIHGRDLTSFASFVASMAALLGAIQAMIFAHSTKEDWIELQHRKLDLQQQAVNVVVNNEPPASSAPTVKS
jgi:hypothetical protein